MELIRLYITQDNRQWQETIKQSDMLERLAELELTGATVHHATRMTPIKPSRPKRSSLAGAARHLYA
jgi:hypothetical protein